MASRTWRHTTGVPPTLETETRGSFQTQSLRSAPWLSPSTKEYISIRKNKSPPQWQRVNGLLGWKVKENKSTGLLQSQDSLWHWGTYWWQWRWHRYISFSGFFRPGALSGLIVAYVPSNVSADSLCKDNPKMRVARRLICLHGDRQWKHGGHVGSAGWSAWVNPYLLWALTADSSGIWNSMAQAQGSLCMTSVTPGVCCPLCTVGKNRVKDQWSEFGLGSVTCWWFFFFSLIYKIMV